MIMKIWMSTLFTLALALGAIGTAAQESASVPPSDEQQKEKAEKEKRAFALLEQVVDEAQLLRLPENRIRVQIGAAELLWQSNEGRARSLFSQAGEGVAEMLRNTNTEMPIGDRRSFNQTRTPGQLRQELVLTVARHDAPLAYQILAATRPPTPVNDPSGDFALYSEDSLEQRLLAQVAALDPKLALQNAELLLEKGKYPQSLIDVLAQLQAKDKEAATRLEEKLLKRLASANMLTTADAGSLALNLLQSGPRLAKAPTGIATVSRAQAQLAQSGYADLMGIVIDAALKATPQSVTNQPRQNRGRGRGASTGGVGGGSQTNPSSAQTQAETEQSNARRLLSGLQRLLTQVDQNLPSRAQALRQKIAEVGITNGQRANMNPVMNGPGQNTSEGMMAAAAAAPAGSQSRIYRRAALMALEEGNIDRARQIATEHLEASARDSILQSVELQQVAKKEQPDAIDEVRRMVSGLANDDQRIDLLLQLAARAQQDNARLALLILEEARLITNKRASSYQQFEQQLRVADAFTGIEPARSFEILEPGIMQLNELLSAAATLSGFEVNVFREGEMPLQGGNGLSNMVLLYAQRLGALATKDFERSQNLANRFQMAEPRIVARLSIVRGMLGLEPAVTPGSRRGRQGGFLRRGQ